MARQPSQRRIDKERHNKVTRMGVCPGCGDQTIVSIPRMIGSEDAMDRRRYGGTYLACGNRGHLCWHMTKNRDARNLYETFGPEAVPNWLTPVIPER